MLPQPNLNQEIQMNTLYLKRAIIKDAQGKNIMIDWSSINQDHANQSISENIQVKEEITPSSRENQRVNKINIVVQKIEDEKVLNKKTNNSSMKEEVNHKENKIPVSNSTNTKPIVNIGDSTVKNVNASKNNKSNPKQNNIKTYYGISTSEAFNIQKGVGGKIQKNGAWVNATANEIRQYFEPSQENINKYKFQFLNLASPAGISVEDAKAYLKNKGILSGKEETFIAAAKANNVNEIYLMAHACLETGNGTSRLATGVNYNGTIVYNMFGIGAVDSNPIGGGSAYAYKMGWTTPEKAILGGAEFISKQYINNYPYNQDTLYEMRWNPASPGRHQYATDIGWATKQAAWMEKIYSSFKSATITFDIPVYRK